MVGLAVRATSTIVVEAIVNVVDHGMQIQEAVNAPRIHHRWLPDQTTVEPFALSPDTVRMLMDMGYKIVEQAPWGLAEAILIGPATDITATRATSGNDTMARKNQHPAGCTVHMMTGDRRVPLQAKRIRYLATANVLLKLTCPN